MTRFLAVVSGLLVCLCPAIPAKGADPVFSGPPNPDPLVPVDLGPMVSNPYLSDTAPPPPGDTVPMYLGSRLAFDDSLYGTMGHFYAGAGAYLIHPFFENNLAFKATVTGSTTTAAGGIVNTFNTSQAVQQDFVYDGLRAAPLIWLGYTLDNGLGVRARWWHFDQDASAFVNNGDTSGSTVISSATPLGIGIRSPGPVLAMGVGADALAFQSNLRFDVWDGEVTRDFQLGDWSLLLSGGARYVHMAQNYQAFRHNSGIAANGDFFQDTATLLSGHNFNGAGPTVALELQRPLGGTGFAFYGNARGALLFGSGKQETGLLSEFSGSGKNFAFDTVTAKDSFVCRDALLPVVEVEVGAEYGRDVGRFHPFIRTGLFGQTWFGAGNASSTTGNLGFLGLSATAGVQF